MAIGPGQAGYPFTVSGIIANAPNNSGVYALYNARTWVYVGESGDIQARLLQHVNENGTCIKHQGATNFVYELCDAANRVRRQDQLILSLGPLCNQKLG